MLGSRRPLGAAGCNRDGNCSVELARAAGRGRRNTTPGSIVSVGPKGRRAFERGRRGVRHLMPVGGTTVVGTGYARPSMMPKPELRSGTGGAPVRRGREAGAGANPRTHPHRRAGSVHRELPSARTRLQVEPCGGKIRPARGTRSQTNNLTYAVVLSSVALVLGGALCGILLWNSEPGGFSTHRRADTTTKHDRLADADAMSSANVVAKTWNGVPADADAPTRYGTLQADALRKLGQSRTAAPAGAGMNPAPPEPARSSVN